jgi:hypothetical protein
MAMSKKEELMFLIETVVSKPMPAIAAVWSPTLFMGAPSFVERPADARKKIPGASDMQARLVECA